MSAGVCPQICSWPGRSQSGEKSLLSAQSSCTSCYWRLANSMHMDCSQLFSSPRCSCSEPSEPAKGCTEACQPLQEHNPGSPLGREAKEAGQQNGTSSPHQHSPLRDGHGHGHEQAENGDLPETNGDMPVQDEVVGGLPSADELAVDAAPKKDQ